MLVPGVIQDQRKIAIKMAYAIKFSFSFKKKIHLGRYVKNYTLIERIIQNVAHTCFANLQYMKKTHKYQLN